MEHPRDCIRENWHAQKQHALIRSTVQGQYYNEILVILKALLTRFIPPVSFYTLGFPMLLGVQKDPNDMKWVNNQQIQLNRSRWMSERLETNKCSTETYLPIWGQWGIMSNDIPQEWCCINKNSQQYLTNQENFWKRKIKKVEEIKHTNLLTYLVDWALWGRTACASPSKKDSLSFHESCLHDGSGTKNSKF